MGRYENSHVITGNYKSTQNATSKLPVSLVLSVDESLQHVILALGLSPCLDRCVEYLLYLLVSVVTATVYKHQHHPSLYKKYFRL